MAFLPLRLSEFFGRFPYSWGFSELFFQSLLVPLFSTVRNFPFARRSLSLSFVSFPLLPFFGRSEISPLIPGFAVTRASTSTFFCAFYWAFCLLLLTSPAFLERAYFVRGRCSLNYALCRPIPLPFFAFLPYPPPPPPADIVFGSIQGILFSCSFDLLLP